MFPFSSFPSEFGLAILSKQGGGSLSKTQPTPEGMASRLSGDLNFSESAGVEGRFFFRLTEG